MVDPIDWNGRQFLEKVLRTHDRIREFRREDDYSYQLTLKDDREMCIVAVNIYRMGLADLLELVERYPQVDCVINVSVWNDYTGEAKEYALSRKLGLFKLKEFMGALNWTHPWKYVPPDEREENQKSNKKRT